MAIIGIYVHHPYCSEDSAVGISSAIGSSHSCTYFDETDITPEFLSQFDLIVFPGGIGDADRFSDVFHWKKAAAVNEYVRSGGKYLGICMGAYWAGSHYFDIISGIDAVQYIRQPDALVKRSYGTVVNCEWNKEEEVMYFYDGCTFTGNMTGIEVVGRYADVHKHPMAIIQGNVGLIGTHPEAQDYWYDTWSYMPDSYHEGVHYKLLREFVEKLL